MYYIFKRQFPYTRFDSARPRLCFLQAHGLVFWRQFLGNEITPDSWGGLIGLRTVTIKLHNEIQYLNIETFSLMIFLMIYGQLSLRACVDEFTTTYHWAKRHGVSQIEGNFCNFHLCFRLWDARCTDIGWNGAFNWPWECFSRSIVCNRNDCHC